MDFITSAASQVATPARRVNNSPFELTEEQWSVIDHTVDYNGHMKVSAYAGAAKTSTMIEVAKAVPNKRFQYLAFNRSIALEADSKFPRNTDCKTSHSLAFRAGGSCYAERLVRYNGFQLHKDYSVGNYGLFNGKFWIKGNFILDTIRRYCQSGDRFIQTSHTPYADLSKFFAGDMSGIQYAQKSLVEEATRFFKMMADVNHPIPITHDVYLKLFQLTEPQLHCDGLILDEAQDTNGVLWEIIRNQRNCRIFIVGDTYQTIYGWRGALDIMGVNMEHELLLSKSFRFGPELASLASSVLNAYIPDANVRIYGFEQMSTKIISDGFIEKPDAVICRTNKGVIEATIYSLDAGFRTHIVGGASSLIGMFEGVIELQTGGKTHHRDLKLFDNWEQVVEFSNSPLGGDLSVIVKLVETYGPTKLIELLKRTTDYPQPGDVNVMTAHKCKGLEFDCVKLWDDFMFDQNPDAKRLITEDEAKLLYVACTRAQKELEVSNCVPIKSLV